MNTAYPLFPVSVITILAYFTTWLFARWGIFNRKSHRKFWNVLLLISFLISGLLGLLSVVKVNYKLEIPGYETLMQWHVSFGIGMVIIAVFHLTWHWKYYFSFKKGTGEKKIEKPNAELNDPIFTKTGYLLFLLGVLAIINQVVFIREFISVMAGNELILGVVMASWLLLTGWGAYIGRKGISADFKLRRGINMLIALAIFPAISVAMLYWLKSMLFPPGTLTGIGTAIIGALLLLFPVCFLSGYLFTAFSTLLSSSKNKNLVGKAYALESLGSLTGGLVFSFILGRFFNALEIFALTTAIVLFVGTWLAQKQFLKLSLITLAILVPILAFIFNPDTSVKKLLYPSQDIVQNQSTRYGNLIITKQADQLNFYENNTLQFYTGNFMSSEEAVHFAMVQQKHPQNVLLLSGGIAGMIKEINKYPVEKVTYLEPNPEAFKYWKNLADSLEDFSKVEFVKADIRTFLTKTNAIYDVILINLPPPSTLGMNRFYTDQFFKIIKKHCNSQTVICTSLPSTMNYAETNALELNASLWKTLGTYFPNLLILPGEKNYFLASEAPLSSNITALIAQKNIQTEYVNSYYISDQLVKQRSQLLEARIKSVLNQVKVNRDFHPYLFIKQALHWLSHFGTSYYLLVIIPVLLFVLLFVRLNPVSMGLYTGGFTAASLEVTLMLAYQVFYGSIYLATSLFFAFFMGGLALGSLLTRKPSKFPLVKSYAFLQFLLATFALLVPLFIWINEYLSVWSFFSQVLFFVVVFALAFGIGYEFYLASELQAASISETSGINYSTDLAGSAFGAFLTAIVLLPLMGIFLTCAIVSGLNLISGTAALLTSKS